MLNTVNQAGSYPESTLPNAFTLSIISGMRRGRPISLDALAIQPVTTTFGLASAAPSPSSNATSLQHFRRVGCLQSEVKFLHMLFMVRGCVGIVKKCKDFRLLQTKYQ